MSLSLFPIRALVLLFLPIESALLLYPFVLPIPLPSPQYIRTYPALALPSSLRASPHPSVTAVPSFLPQRFAAKRQPCPLYTSYTISPPGGGGRSGSARLRSDTLNKPHYLLTQERNVVFRVVLKKLIK
jgi:hypothetical protein